MALDSIKRQSDGFSTHRTPLQMMRSFGKLNHDFGLFAPNAQAVFPIFLLLFVLLFSQGIYLFQLVHQHIQHFIQNGLAKPNLNPLHKSYFHVMSKWNSCRDISHTFFIFLIGSVFILTLSLSSSVS